MKFVYSLAILGSAIALLSACQSLDERCTPSRLLGQLEAQTPGDAAGLIEVHHDDGLWVAVGHDGGILTSADGFEWTARDSGTTEMLIDVHHAANQWVAVGTNGVVITSHDGTTWSRQISGTSDWLFGVYHANGEWIAVGGTIDEADGRDVTRSVSVLRSTDGVRWIPQNDVTGEMLLDVHYADGIWVAVGWNGAIVTSTNGSVWTPRISASAQFLLSVDHGDGLWVASGALGTIVTSADGESWTYHPTGTTNWLHHVTHADDRWLVVGGDIEHSDYYPMKDSSTVVTSRDGRIWTPINLCTAHELHGADYADERWIIVGLESGLRRDVVPLILTADSLDR